MCQYAQGCESTALFRTGALNETLALHEWNVNARHGFGLVKSRTGAQPIGRNDERRAWQSSDTGNELALRFGLGHEAFDTIADADPRLLPQNSNANSIYRSLQK
jgi:hypothetical protein